MTDIKTVEIYAPVSGKTISIDTIPDPVFAEKTIGDGISINPESDVLIAPCDGVIANIHSAHHALTLITVEGIEVLMHIGLDTVMLKGEGLHPKVEKGQTVKKGDKLIAFDRAVIEKAGKSLLTEIVITNMDKVKKLTPVIGKEVSVTKDVVLTVEVSVEATASASKGKSGNVETAESWGIEIKNPAGLHARPIAVLAAAAKKFSADIVMIKGGKEGNAKSLVSIMGLDVKKGEEIRLKATGIDAVQALKSLIPVVESGLGEDLTKAAATTSAEKPEEPKTNGKDTDNMFYGVTASPGVAVGVVVQLHDAAIHVDEFGGQPAEEKHKLSEGLKEARHQLEDLYHQTKERTGAEKAAIFLAHQELLDDPELVQSVDTLMEEGKSAAFAWQKSINQQAGALANLNNEMLAARANDLNDVGKRVLRILTGKAEEKLVLPENAIVIAQDLSPSDTASLDHDKVVGFCTVKGGSVSHAAILARSLMMPAVSGVSKKVLNILNGTHVLLDGRQGFLKVNPTAEEQAAVLRETEEEKRQRDILLKSKDEPAVTTDGVHIEVGGNVGSAYEAKQVVENGGEGIGLLRSEFLFLDRRTAPTEDEQAAVYSEIAETLGKERNVIIRTLDVGGDKPLSYLPQPMEENPFLGVRGIRLGLRHPDMLRSQVRAIFKAADKTKMRMMFPMVTTLDELIQARQLVLEEQKAFKDVNVEIGIMVEVPAAAVMADILAPHVDFFSIGTNDLTQYTMAMDRGNAELVKQADGLHPAVLRLIKSTVDGAERSGKWVGVCGSLASEKEAVPVFVGLGVKELSVPAALIPVIKDQIRKLSVKECQDLAASLLKEVTAEAVRQKINTFLNDKK